MKKTAGFLIFGLCLLIIVQFAQGQIIVKRYDWDSNTDLGAPTVAVTQTPSGGANCTYTGANGSNAGTVPAQKNDGTAGGTVLPVNSTYGVNTAAGATDAAAGLLNDAASNAFYNIGGVSTCSTPRRIVQLTFPAVSGSLLVNYGSTIISFRSIGLALDSATSGSGTDQNDRVFLQVSLDNGATFSNEIGLSGNTNSQIDYNPTNTFSLSYNGTTTAAPPANSPLASQSTTANPNSRAELTIPPGTINASSQLVLRFVIQTDRGDELVGLDDIIVAKQLMNTAAAAAIKGRVTNEAGRGINFAAVSALNIQTGETKIVKTNPFGYYSFNNLPSGNFYVLSVSHKQYKFSENHQSLTLNEDVEGINFVGRNQ